MTSGHEPTAAPWGAMRVACRDDGDLQLYAGELPLPARYSPWPYSCVTRPLRRGAAVVWAVIVPLAGDHIEQSLLPEIEGQRG